MCVRSLIVGWLCSVAGVLLWAGGACGQAGAGSHTVAVYWWPNFHCDAFHQSKKGQGWTEWEIVKKAKPRFEGHAQPKVPLWGYRDEADPRNMVQSIDAMADAGIGAIIFDWYRYEDNIHGGMMLERALRDGFLKAPNRQRIKFALMWANHMYIDCHPFAPGKDFGNATLWRSGEISRAAFDRHTSDAIAKYFSQPNYWKINGKPYFSIYELGRLIHSLGGVAATRNALDGFRARARAAGFPGVHLNFVDWAMGSTLAAAKGQPMPGEPSRKIQTLKDLSEALGMDSATWYTWVHHVAPVGGAPAAPAPAAVAGPLSPQVLAGNAAKAGVQVCDYVDWGRRAMQIQARRGAELGVPFFPHVARGWDGSPRNYQGGIVVGDTPERFQHFLAEAKALVDKHPECNGIVTINSWNEWVEGSYLEPDTTHGLKYLDAIRDVFGGPRAARPR